ncbi:MAG: hypothetical protein J2P31_09335 [Blastocatellia bacterium]|nr:hypothetical protein [Blastocatellia bacterium]
MPDNKPQHRNILERHASGLSGFLKTGGLNPITRAATPEKQVFLLHRQMQREIIRCLVKPGIPGRTIEAEVSGIDILVIEHGVATIIEIKTGDDIIYIIREAIGQLLEYQYFCQRNVGMNPRLMIVSPLKIIREAIEYLEFLEKEYNLNIYYSQYVPGSYSFTLLYQKAALSSARADKSN